MFCAIPIFMTIFLSRFVERNQKLAHQETEELEWYWWSNIHICNHYNILSNVINS